MSLPPPRTRFIRVAGILAWMAGSGGFVSGQVPNSLRHSFFAPKTLPQEFESQGFSVALAGNFAVVGAPFRDLDEVSRFDCGVVKIHDAASGVLLHLLESPDESPFGYFGQAVAISGTTVVVGSGSPVGGFSYAGRVHVYDLSSATPAVPVLSLDNPAPAAFDLFGHSVAVDGDRVVVGAWHDDAGESNSGSVYVYDLASPTPAVPVHTLVNPSPAEDDNFGVAVAVSAARVVVAAYGDDTEAPNAGRVYVYDVESGTPTQPVTALANPAAGENDGFGNAVAIAGTKVVVGVEASDANAINAGSAMVFDLASPTPTEPASVLASPAPQANGYFGSAVSISTNRVVVGEYRDSTTAGNAGACHVYNLAGGTPSVATATLTKLLPEEGDYFGNSVAVSGATVLAGAWRDDTGDVESGGSYVFDLGSPMPEAPVATLQSPVSNSADRFGTAVAISGDLVAVGAPGSDAGATAAGLVKTYDLASSTPTTAIFTLANPSPAWNDGFGGAVAVSGTRVLVGAAGDDTGAGDAGCAYVYDLASATPDLPVLTIPNPAPAAGDGFGGSVAISGGFFVVGAETDDAGAANAGSAYVFDFSSATPAVPVSILPNPAPAADDRFGGSVAISGVRVVVGSALDNATSTDAGRAYIYDIGSPTPAVPIHTLENPSPQPGDLFGCAVAVAANRVAVGASGDDAGAVNGGSVHVYDLSSPTPNVPHITLGAPVPAADDGFGNSVAVSGNRVAVGVMLANGPTDSGRVHSYNLSSPSPGVPSASIAKTTPAAGDQFGASVAVDAAIIVVGTPFDNKTATDKGAAYVFGPADPEIAVETASGEDLANGEAADFGAVAIGSGGGGTLEFSILNTGITALSLTQITLEGGNAGDFAFSTSGPSVAAGDDNPLTVTLNPSSPGNRTTTLRIVNSDTDENPFEIQLSGQALSTANDTDLDGLNDVAELNMAALGFDWALPNPELVEAFQSTSDGAGFFAPERVQSLRVPAPAISRDSGTGQVILSMHLEKATSPQNYLPFPMSVPQTSINPQGKLEFLFSVPDDAAFFRLVTD